MSTQDTYDSAYQVGGGWTVGRLDSWTVGRKTVKERQRSGFSYGFRGLGNLGSNRERGIVFDIRISIELVTDLGAWLARSYGMFSVVKLGLFGNS